MVQKLLKVLAQDLTFSDNSNYRKGGLIGLAAASIALGKQIQMYLPQIITVNALLTYNALSELCVNYELLSSASIILFQRLGQSDSVLCL